MALDMLILLLADMFSVSSSYKLYKFIMKPIEEPEVAATIL